MLSIVGRAFSHASSIGLSNKDVASSVRSATTTVVAVELKRESNTILSLLPLKGRTIGKNSHILYCVKRLRSSLTMPALHILDLEYLNRLKTATFSRNKKSQRFLHISVKEEIHGAFIFSIVPFYPAAKIYLYQFWIRFIASDPLDAVFENNWKVTFSQHFCEISNSQTID